MSVFTSFKQKLKKGTRDSNIRKKSYMDITNGYLLSDDQQIQNNGRRRLMFHMIMQNIWSFFKWLLYDACWLLFFYSFLNYANSYIANLYLLKKVNVGIANGLLGTMLINAGLVTGSMIIAGYAIIKHGWISWAYPHGSFKQYIQSLNIDHAQQTIIDNEQKAIQDLLASQSVNIKNHRLQLKRDLFKTYGSAKGNLLYQKYQHQITKDGHFKTNRQ